MENLVQLIHCYSTGQTDGTSMLGIYTVMEIPNPVGQHNFPQENQSRIKICNYGMSFNSEEFHRKLHKISVTAKSIETLCITVSQIIMNKHETKSYSNFFSR